MVCQGRNVTDRHSPTHQTFVPMNCLHEETFSHLDSLLLETMLPLGLLGVALLVTAARSAQLKRAGQAEAMAQVLSNWLSVALLLLPVIGDCSVPMTPHRPRTDPTPTPC